MTRAHADGPSAMSGMLLVGWRYWSGDVVILQDRATKGTQVTNSGQVIKQACSIMHITAVQYCTCAVQHNLLLLLLQQLYSAGIREAAGEEARRRGGWMEDEVEAAASESRIIVIRCRVARPRQGARQGGRPGVCLLMHR